MTGSYPRRTLLFYTGHDEIEFDAILASLIERRPDTAFEAVASCPTSVVSDQVQFHPATWTRQGRVLDLEGCDITAVNFDEVLLYVPDSVARPMLSVPLINDIFSRNVRRLCYLRPTLRAEPYAPFAGTEAKTLVVFPGPMIPLHLGSHRRGLNLVLQLNLAGQPCDVLITSGRQSDLPQLRVLLQAVAPRVYTYVNKKKPLPLRKRLRRGTENLLRRGLGHSKPAPELFSERACRRPTDDAQRQLAALVATQNYRRVIINYAWMIPVMGQVENRKDIFWICDTHDVQFVRDADQNTNEFRLGYRPRKERALEIALLKRMNKVLAISKSDAEVLRESLGEKKVILCTSAFDYVNQMPKRRNVRQPLTFGFIGTRMKANAVAVEHVIKEWWPTIIKTTPASRLFIAGTVCDDPGVRDMCFLDPSIELLGRVESLKDFYRRVDVVLSPVLVQGGLNFKSMEALAAGCHLFTNPLGARDLEALGQPFLIRDEQDLVKALCAIETDPTGEWSRRKCNYDAVAKHAGSSSFDELVGLLAAG